ncbi:MAG TPA: M23 family metallopeptidase [Gaiellaceae bacterium]|nr:M23 family metallopeptidase [Gaiellaceae bacterium]
MTRRLPALVLLPAVLATAAALAPGSFAHARTPAPGFAPAPPPFVAAVRDTEHVARPSLCDDTSTSSPFPWPTRYPWPIAPFHEQHAIRGYFGDPRTVFRDETDPQLGAFSFHNGVDIVADEGTPVYPVVDGTVTEVRVNEVVVASDDGRRIFQYWHISPGATVGEKVVAQHDVLGWVQAPARHVHLTEIDDGVVQNPLQPGHLTPYRDATTPAVDSLYLRSADGKNLRPRALTGPIELVTRALDMPALPVPEPWAGLPVSPARVGFEVTTPDGREVLPPMTPVDFAETEPGNRSFFDKYAPGTFQNVPAVGKHLYHELPGEYLYRLTPALLDTSELVPGPYVVTVTAEDTCGNAGTLSEPIDVLTQPSPAGRLRAHPAVWPRHVKEAWTVEIASIETREGFGAAREAARLAAAAGVTDVGVLDGSHFVGPRRDTFLVFSGVYFSPDDAGAALERVQDVYPHAFVREVKERVRKKKPKPVRPAEPRRGSAGRRPLAR